MMTPCGTAGQEVDGPSGNTPVPAQGSYADFQFHCHMTSTPGSSVTKLFTDVNPGSAHYTRPSAFSEHDGRNGHSDSGGGLMAGGDATPLPKTLLRQFWVSPGARPADYMSDFHSLMMDNTDDSPMELQPGSYRACDGLLDMHDNIPSLSTALSVVRPSTGMQADTRAAQTSSGFPSLQAGGPFSAAADGYSPAQQGRNDMFIPWSIQEKESDSDNLTKLLEIQEGHLHQAFPFGLSIQNDPASAPANNDPPDLPSLSGGTRFVVQPGGILRQLGNAAPHQSVTLSKPMSAAANQMQGLQPGGSLGAASANDSGRVRYSSNIGALGAEGGHVDLNYQQDGFNRTSELDVPVELSRTVTLPPPSSTPHTNGSDLGPRQVLSNPSSTKKAGCTTMKPRTSSRAKGSTSKAKQAVAKEPQSARSSKYRGVTKHRRSGRWEAHIWVKEIGRQVYLGGYESEDHAAEAYDVAAIKCKGETVKTNFDKSRYVELIGYIDNITLEELVMSVRRQSQGFARGSSKYRGVTHHPTGRWEARIGVPGSKHIYLGLFNDEDKAGAAYDRALVLLRGSTAATNFSLSDYREQLTQYHQIQRDVLANGKLDGEAVLRTTSAAIRDGIEGRAASKGVRAEAKATAVEDQDASEGIQWFNELSAASEQDHKSRGFVMPEGLSSGDLPSDRGEEVLQVSAQCDASMAFSGDEMQPFM